MDTQFVYIYAKVYIEKGKLNGLTFTVELRITNPEDKTEFYVVNEINHSFAE